ncbi:ester cyclase [Frankia sp. QA3]|uniref:ester cyclase n=1 Tax=Frankia sp. QA3 TaxID=710111 RepID=UPI000269C2AA|nr:ester cyclase [Frankia sp. QA3]EIV91024.1 putative ester cyclase [Frankia sp. QA3]
MPWSSSRSNAADVHRRVVEKYSEVLAGRLDDALTLIDPGVIDHRGGQEGDHHGIDAWRRKWEHLNEEFQDVSATIEQNVSTEDTSVNRYTLRSTHTGSGRRYEVTGLDMVKVRDGKVVEYWALADEAALRHQLGLAGA